MQFTNFLPILVVVQIQCSSVLTAQTSKTLFAALSSMMHLVQHEHNLLEAVEYYTNRRLDKLQVIKDVYQKWGKLHEEAQTSFLKNKEDTVAKLKLIQRITRHWPELKYNFLDKSQDQKGLENVYNRTYISDIKDVRGFARLLIVNAEIYQKKIEEMMGLRNPFVSLDEYLELGYRIKHHSLGKSDHDALIKSSQIVLYGLAEHTNQSLGIIKVKITSTRWEFLSNLTFELYETGYWNLGYSICKKILEVSPEDVEFLFKVEMFADRLSRSNYKDRMDSRTAVQEQDDESLDQRLFNKLCRQKKLILPPTPDLKCYFSQKNPHLRRIAGYKTEDVAHSPVVRIFHDVILDGEIDLMKTLAFPLLNIARVFSPNEDVDISEDRISNNAWLLNPDFNEQSPEQAALYRKLNQRLTDCTGLNNKGTEGLQVNNYGIGGHYLWHYDALYYNSKKEGYKDDRIATWMFYLNDVIEGGNTVFPRLNISVPPEKGAALFWYNFHPTGLNDFRTLHGGCPIIQGTKWVTNMWVRSFPQVFDIPCLKGGDREKTTWEEFSENYRE